MMGQPVRVSSLVELLLLKLGIQEVVVSKELESFWVLTLKMVPSLKESSKAPTVVTAWGEQLSVELRVIEDCQSKVTGLPVDECFVLGVEQLLKALPVFEGPGWT
jgi:hypothetical protein